MTTERFRILAADDELAILEGYSSVLGSTDHKDQIEDSLAALDSELFGLPAAEHGNGFDVTLCRQGDEAVAAVREAVESGRPYSVAFLDVRMPPGMDGVQAAERIRALDPDINIVMVTGYADLSVKEMAARVRPLDKFLYCQKPIQSAELEQFASALSAKWSTEKTLVAAKDLAQRADRAKSQFLANMSHELRTPLNAVIGFSEIIKSEVMGPIHHEQYRGYVHDIHDCGTHLLAVINDILDLSKVELGRFELREEPLDLGGLLADSVRLMERPARDAGHDLRLDVPDDLPGLMADERALKQVMINLLSNAIKFTPKAGKIKVTARGGPGGIRVTVRDTGIGIPADQVPVALEPFRQIDAGLSRVFEGTGLGLPLTAAICKLHGGTIRIDSELGKGTTVTVHLPAERITVAETAA